ncbi:MAG: hypothetical protein KKD90_00700 [Candidatus Omnitrophica bacterium]|nr:hypothetical protein [Candidatus Omnitrophota bacterium]
METFKQIFVTFRDLLIPFMPRFIVRLLVGKGDFIFMAHAIDLSDFSKKYPFADWLPKNHLKAFSKNLWTIIGSKITGFRLKDGTVSNGWLIFCPLSTRMMVLKKEMARKKIIKAARFAEKLDVKILGLGAFIPILSDDGMLLADKVNMAITTGNNFSAVIAAKNVLEISRRVGLDTAKAKLAVVGAAGSVGSVASKLMDAKFKYKILIDKNLAALNKTCEEFSFKHSDTVISNNINLIKEADVVLAVTNVPGAVVRSAHLKPGALVVDAAQPKNVSGKIPVERKDVIVVESGIAEAENLKVNFDFGLRKENEVFSCLAEVLLLLWMDRVESHLGSTDYNYAEELMDVFEGAGIKLADFRNRLGFITQGEIDNIASIIRDRDSDEFLPVSRRLAA